MPSGLHYMDEPLLGASPWVLVPQHSRAVVGSRALWKYGRRFMFSSLCANSGRRVQSTRLRYSGQLEQGASERRGDDQHHAISPGQRFRPSSQI